MPKLALAQMSMSNSLDDNLAKSISMMKTAADLGADVIAFPEIQLSPFFPQYTDFNAEPYKVNLDHDAVKSLCAASRDTNLISAPNLYLVEGDNAYDACLLIDRNGSIVGVSKMVHVTQAPNFYEQNYYAPAHDGFHVYDTDAGKIGVVICFDRHYPESIRSCAFQGADIVLIPTVNMTDEPLEMFEWELRVAAYHNSVYIAMCNRVGAEGAADYCGRSTVVDPAGEIILRADDQEAVLSVDYDLQLVADTRKNNKFLELYRAEAFDLGR